MNPKLCKNSFESVFLLPQCFGGGLLPVYLLKPSSIIAYTLSSLDYHCLTNNVSVEEMRSCRSNNNPSIQELESKVKQFKLNQRLNVKREIEIRKQLSNNTNANINSNPTENNLVNNNNCCEIESEIDLNNLLDHIPKIPNVSKLEYLINKNEYNRKRFLKSNGPSIRKLNLNLDDSELETKIDEIENNYTTFKYSKRNKHSKSNSSLFAMSVSESGIHPSTNTIDGLNNNSINSIDKSKRINIYKQFKFTSKLNRKDERVSFNCYVYYPKQFSALRNRLSNKLNNESEFIESLSNCDIFDTSGGVANKGFFITTDNRFVLKKVESSEFQQFQKNAESYFEHIARILYLNYPSLFLHIVGIYQVSWTIAKLINANVKKSKHWRTIYNEPTHYFIVMPNLNYGKNISKLFDLKGSLMGRDAIKKNMKGKVGLDIDWIDFWKGIWLSIGRII